MLNLLMFTMDTCQPCKRMLPLVHSLCVQQDVPLEVIDALEDNRSIHYCISSVPTLILLEDGNEVNRLVGTCPTTELTKFLTKNGNG